MDGYARAHFRYGTAIEATVTRQWVTLGGVDDASAAAFGQAAARVAGVGRAGAARLTSTFLTRQVAMLTDGHVRAVDIDIDDLATPALRSGLTDAELWLRPVVTARTYLSRGARYADAMASGRATAAGIAHTDVALAQRYATRASLYGDDRVVGVRRVPGWRACRLCSLAAERVYYVRDLMPIHTSCRCTTSAVVDGRDPGARRNAVTERAATGPLPDDYVIDLTTEIAPSLQEVNA